MNKHIKTLYILMLGNKAIIAESNLKELVNRLPDEIKDFRGYDYYYKQMKETEYLILPFNARYALQRMDY